MRYEYVAKKSVNYESEKKEKRKYEFVRNFDIWNLRMRNDNI